MKTACLLPKIVPNDDTYIQTTSPGCPLSSMDPPTEMEDKDSRDREDDHFNKYPNLVQFFPISKLLAYAYVIHPIGVEFHQ